MAWTLVTGASTGLGAEFVRQLAEAGHSVVLVARRRAAMEEIAAEVAARCGVETEVIVADLADAHDLERVAQRLRSSTNPIDLLVNNAGFALAQPFVGGDLDRELMALNVMVKAVAVLSHAAVGRMVERGHGAILNVSSIAADTAMGTYAAAKSWVNTFTEALATELRGTGVSATTLRPGTIETDFFTVMGYDIDNIPRPIRLSAEEVVRAALRAVSRGQVECVPSLTYKVVDRLRRHAPRRLIRLVAGHSAASPLQI